MIGPINKNSRSNSRSTGNDGGSGGKNLPDFGEVSLALDEYVR
jgi:hypothetical protein